MAEATKMPAGPEAGDQPGCSTDAPLPSSSSAHSPPPSKRQKMEDDAKKEESEVKKEEKSEGLETSEAGKDGAEAAGGKKKRKRVRKRPSRGRHRKPYHKLSYEELKELESREAARAEQRRAAQFAGGRAMAPYNTTQFIMEDLEARNGEPDMAGLVERWKERGGSRERTCSGTGSWEDSGSVSSDGSRDLDLDAEFDADYASASLERLQNMEKPELINNVVGLETELSRSDVEKRELRQMVNRLRQDNYALRKTLRENGLQEVRPASAPPRQPQDPDSFLSASALRSPPPRPNPAVQPPQAPIPNPPTHPPAPMDPVI